MFRAILLMVVCFSVFGGVKTQARQRSGNQVHFEIYEDNPLLAPDEGAWDGRFVFSPHVVAHEDKLYMFYTGFSGRTDAGAISIGLATSTDGYVWEKYENNPIVTANEYFEQVSFPAVFVDNDEWVMFLNNVGIRSGKPQSTIWRLTAPAPEGPWQVSPETPIMEGPSGHWNRNLTVEDVVRIDDEYFAYFTGLDRFLQQSRIGLARSDDGIHWTFYDDSATADTQADPIIDLGAENSWDGMSVSAGNALPTDDGWEMFFFGYDREISVAPTEGQNTVKMGYATSTDGVQWQKEPDPVFDTEQLGWPRFYAIRFNGQYLIYYDEYRPGNVFGINLMIGEIEE